MAKLKSLSNGWQLIIEKDELEKVCFNCGNELKKSFYFCPIRKKGLCIKCDKNWFCKSIEDGHTHYKIIEVKTR